MATTLVPKNPVWRRSSTRSGMPMEKRLVLTTATWKAGQFLVGAATGLVTVAADAATSYHYLAIQDLDSAIGNNTSYRRMARLHEDDIFEMFELDGTIAESSVGEYRAVDVTSNLCTLDDTKTDADSLIVVAPVWREEAYVNSSTDIKARLLASVMESVLYAEPA